MSTQSRKRIIEAFAVTLTLLAVLFGTAVLAQVREVDQGRAATTTAKVWLVKVCDSAGGNCGFVAVSNTALGNALAVRCVDPTGTAFVDCGGAGGGGGGTVAQGAAGSSTAPWFVTGTIVQMPVLNVGTMPIMNVGTMPTVTVTGTVLNNGGTVTATPVGTTTITGTVTGTVNATPVGTTTITGTVTGTVNATPVGTTTVTGTVQSNAGAGTQAVNFTNTAITAHQGAAANGTLGWPFNAGVVTAGTASWTSATGSNTTLSIATTGYATVLISNNPVTITGGVLTPEVSDDGGTTWYPAPVMATTSISAIPALTIGPTTVGMYTVSVAGMTNFRLRLSTVLTGAGTDVIRIQASAAPRDAWAALTQAASTLGVNLTALSGVAISTAAPFIDGGRASTDTRAAVADAAAVALRLSKWGDVIVMPAPIDMWATANTGSLTATTVSAVLAAPGAAYRWAVTGWNTCNLSGVVATQINLLDGTTIKDSFPWTQTATTAGESRCYMDVYNPPILFTANSAVNVQLTVSNVTGVRFVVNGYKTGT